MFGNAGYNPGDAKPSFIQAARVGGHIALIGVLTGAAGAVPVLISDKVNIWREIDAANAGFVADDTVDGTTTLLGEAVERALDPNGDGDPSDHVDALGVALGTPFGSPDDADALILANAARAGVVVVAAAGDAGDSYYAVSTPAISDPGARLVARGVLPARATRRACAPCR